MNLFLHIKYVLLTFALHKTVSLQKNPKTIKIKLLQFSYKLKSQRIEITCLRIEQSSVLKLKINGKLRKKFNIFFLGCIVTIKITNFTTLLNIIHFMLRMAAIKYRLNEFRKLLQNLRVETPFSIIKRRTHLNTINGRHELSLLE